MEINFNSKKIYSECANKPHCAAEKYISDEALFVSYDVKANCPFRINLGDCNVCDHIGRNWYFKKHGK